jgi:pimeloyl-ACP methyl ester carboxylesterase
MATLYSKVKGTNPKQIIFIHGNSQSLDIWDEVIEDENLGQYKLITMDLPGHGNSFVSTEVSKDYSIAGMSGHVKDFILPYSMNEYIIVANSAATNLVGEIAADLENCKGIFLTGASIIGATLSPTDILKPNLNAIPFFTAFPTDDAIDVMIDDGTYNMPPADKINCRDIFKKTDPAFREQWAASIARQEWTDEIKNLNALNVPVAVVYGDAENFTFIPYLDKTPLKKWRGKIIIVPNAGHFIQHDQPKLLAQLINEFAEDCFK